MFFVHVIVVRIVNHVFFNGMYKIRWNMKDTICSSEYNRLTDSCLKGYTPPEINTQPAIDYYARYLRTLTKARRERPSYTV